jgi:aryl-alcohol dehydrogenase-like predicted oxidoreductase
MMNRVPLGRTGLTVSRIGIGTWAMGGAFNVGNFAFGWDGGTSAAAEAALRAALDEGVNFFDTAPGYGLGDAERLLGKALAGAPDDVVVVSKAGRRFTLSGWQSDLSKRYLTESCEDSLRSLRRSRIEVLLLKDPPPGQVARSGATDTLSLLRDRGIICYTGFSTHSPETARELLQTGAFDVCEIEYGVLSQRSSEVFPDACAQGAAVVAIAPLYFGWLTGKYKSLDQFPTDDWRRYHFGRWPEMRRADLVAFCREVAQRCTRPERSPAQTALRFVLQSSGITATFVGARNPQQVLDNIGALSAPPLSAEEMHWLRTSGRLVGLNHES